MKALDRVLIALPLVLGGAAMNAHAGCDEPPLVLIPADIEGSESEVIADLEEYRQAMQAYVDCIRTELESAGDDASELYKRVLVARNNRAVAETENVYRWFNSRIGLEAPTGVEAPTTETASPEAE